MAGTVAMTPETVAQAATDTINAKWNVDGTLQDLRTVVDEVRASWSGAAAQKFEAVMEDWNKEATDLCTTLEEIAEQLDQSAAQTAEQDMEASSDIDDVYSEL
ncbi:WXG100 family type VII secretion target [Glycomyces xiaoerkulensis]|uniref:WXG100 family type VII secretion target n=1 Tax=Glycomyces xiaoerkulensis TaxID=2038139 RepID=UPI0013000DEE|nr:WXG100 family type VII secretion target [Glycomyces xiaoerkulensis]